MAPSDLFLTGMARSGTTLLEKLLASHPALSVLSQPYPHLFLELKGRFIDSLGQPRPAHLLEPSFLNHRYAPGEFADFLRGHRVRDAELRRVFEAMQGYAGQWTEIPDLDGLLAGLDAVRFADLLRVLNRRLRHRPHARVCGSKEIRCEEFLRHLLDEGFCCVVVLRDPRDVIASLDHGRGPEFVGKARPVLFDLRMWRNSVAHAIQLEPHPAFHVLRYEDLVTQPARTLEPILESLGLDPIDEDALKGNVHDQQGRPWRGNSSHGATTGLDAGSIGAHRRCLDAGTTRFIETVCFPEMRHLGYADRVAAPDPAFLRAYRETLAVREGDVPRDYSTSPENVAAEQERLAACLGRETDPERAASLFGFGRVAAVLRSACVGVGSADRGNPRRAQVVYSALIFT